MDTPGNMTRSANMLIMTNHTQKRHPNKRWCHKKRRSNKGKRHGMKSRPKEGGRPRGQELEKLQEQLKQRLLGLASDADPRAI